MNSPDELWGMDAKSKALTLRKIGQDDAKWEIYYQDDLTGEQWVMDYPNSELHGGGAPRLRPVVGN